MTTPQPTDPIVGGSYLANIHGFDTAVIHRVEDDPITGWATYDRDNELMYLADSNVELVSHLIPAHGTAHQHPPQQAFGMWVSHPRHGRCLVISNTTAPITVYTLAVPVDDDQFETVTAPVTELSDWARTRVALRFDADTLRPDYVGL